MLTAFSVSSYQIRPAIIKMKSIFVLFELELNFTNNTVRKKHQALIVQITGKKNPELFNNILLRRGEKEMHYFCIYLAK